VPEVRLFRLNVSGINDMSMLDGILFDGEFRSSYSPSRKVFAEVGDPDAGAVQSFKDECDINKIMSKYQKTGALDWVNKHGAQYGDVTAMDFMDAMDTVVKGREMFDALPSSIRDRFRNDPAEFLDFMHDEKNLPEMRELGLAKAPPEPEPTPTPPQAA